MPSCLWMTFILTSSVYIVTGQPTLPNELQKSNSGCFGTGQEIECSCDSGSFVLFDKILLGSKLLDSGCPTSANATGNFNESCCDKSGEDCVYTVDKLIYKSLVNLCNGKASCSIGAANDHVTAEKCNVGVNISDFLPETNYMTVDYYCIEEDRTFGIGGNVTVMETRANTTIYAMNVQTPLPKTSYTITVESDDPTSTFLLYKIVLDVPCNTTVLVMDEHGSEVTNWTCDDNSYTLEVMNVSSSYIEIEFQNNDTLAECKFWFGFQASTESNVTLTYNVPQTTTESSTTAMTTESNTTAMTNETVNSTAAQADDDTFLRDILLITCVPFVVIFTVSVVVTLVCMRRRQKKQDGEDIRPVSDDIEKYFVQSTQYERLKTDSLIEVTDPNPPAPPACRSSNNFESIKLDSESPGENGTTQPPGKNDTTQQKMEKTTEM